MSSSEIINNNEITVAYRNQRSGTLSMGFRYSKEIFTMVKPLSLARNLHSIGNQYLYSLYNIIIRF